MRVLIIEDDISIAELQSDYLEIAGFETLIATNGAQGLDLALAQDFDLIIADIMLPEKNGFEICREIRKEKETPILVVSAKVGDIDKIRALGLGADDYIVKPFSPSELVARVQSHIARYKRLEARFSSASSEENPKSEKISIAALTLNISTHQAFQNDNEIIMTNKEFDLLRYFMQNVDTVLSKEKILQNVWGIDACVETATVAVHVNRLREKIEKDPSSPEWIQTVWGIGYRFCIPIS